MRPDTASANSHRATSELEDVQPILEDFALQAAKSVV